MEYLTADQNTQWMKALSKMSSTLKGETIFLLMGVRMPFGGGDVNVQVALEETWKFMMPYSEQNSNSWMLERGWEAIPASHELAQNYKSAMTLGLDNSWMGIFRPTRQSQ
eukprot:gnl/TRDRNA2_/TRDRNA2_142559_c0_seq2.p1 gnl/TRDRNA2_/TRDRNA2_142559_c0~~gnl/TRDRNA2_/TRDRNA2_142559_c0_seq2.p1  ORF type:complete len:110 (+),score=14.86 gnl/TRDRNA2_/TRDRNA2_142559_c0_seq2:201-530(+)